MEKNNIRIIGNSDSHTKRIAIVSIKKDVLSKKIYRILKRKFSVLYASEDANGFDEIKIEFGNQISFCGFLDYYSINFLIICSGIFDSYSNDVFDEVKNIIFYCKERGVKPIFILERYRALFDKNNVTIIGKDDYYFSYCESIKTSILDNTKGMVLSCPIVFGYDIDISNDNVIDIYKTIKSNISQYEEPYSKIVLADRVGDFLLNAIDSTGEIQLDVSNSDLNFNNNLEESILLRQKGCIFNLIYQLMPTDYFGKQRIAEVRMHLGENLSRFIPDEIVEEIDYVVPVPKTGLYYAMGLACGLKIPYLQGLLKDNTFDRSFQLIDVNSRKKFLKNKISVIDELLQGKSIILVDEAIFTGTTLKMVCNFLEDIGVRKMYIAIPTPQCFSSCDYYIQPKRDMLLQYVREDMLNEYFGVDGVFFQSIEDFNAIIPKVDGLCTECFTRR